MRNSKSSEPIVLSRFILVHLRFLQFFGLCPAQLCHRKPLNRCNGTHHIVWSWLHITLFATLLTSTIVSNKHYLYSGDMFSEFNDLFKLIVIDAAHLLTLIETVVKRRDIHEFLEIYANLHRTWCTLKFQREVSNYSRFLLYNALFFAVNFGIEFFYFTSESTWDSNWYYYLYGYIPSTWICRFRIMQFILFLELVRIELRQLNALILQLTDPRLEASNNLPKEVLSKKTSGDLKRFMELHSQIYKMVTVLKKGMALSLVANYVKTYIKILCDCYWCYWVIYNEKSKIEFVLVVPSVLNIFQILLVSRNCMNEARLVAHNLHKLKVDIDDFGTSVRLENLSLQLLHERINIDACGLFIINCNLVRDVLGSIATYMIFYIQFMPKFPNV